MKNFEDPKALFLKIVGLQEESTDLLLKYIADENIDLTNFREKLWTGYETVAEYIFDELNGKSENMLYVTDNMENVTGDAQLIAGFVRAYVTDLIIKEVVAYEEMEEQVKLTEGVNI